MSIVARRSMRGAALIAAVLVAAVVAAIAVTLTTRDQYAILAVDRVQEQRVALALTRDVELQAAVALTQDIENSRHDDASEAWAVEPYGATQGDYVAEAHLVDAQRLFNLNGLAFQPPNAGADGAPDEDVPPPVDVDGTGGDAAGDTRRATRALLDVSPGVQDLAPVSNPPAVDPTVTGDPAAPPGDPAANGEPSAENEKPLSPQQVAAARFTLLLQALQLPPELLPAVMDWLDADSDRRFPNGAEDEYYMRLDRPYRAANGPFADVSELRLVRGITPEIYATLAPHVTVLDNAVPLNVNTAPAAVLMCIGPGIDRATADLLVGSRDIQPWPDVAAFLRHPLLAGRPLLAQGLATRSSWFELKTRVATDGVPLFRRTLLERLGPNNLRVARRDRLYHDG